MRKQVVALKANRSHEKKIVEHEGTVSDAIVFTGWISVRVCWSRNLG